MTKNDWETFKKKTLIPLYRDELEIQYCENCGKTFGLSFHHLLRRSQGGTNDISNIMLLCLECHHKADNGANYQAFTKQLIEKAKTRYWVNIFYFDNIIL